MASAAVQAIIDDSQCAVCTGGTLFQTMEAGLLLRILSNLGVTMTQAEIMAEATCFTCLGMSLAQAVTLVLLNEISAEIAGGGTGTGGAGVVGAGSPEGVVTAPPGTSYYDTVGLAFWYKTSGVGSVGWTQVV